MLGLTRAQLLGRSIHDFVDAENRAIFDLHVARRAAGHAGGYEVALTRADGHQVHCFNNATPVFDADGRKTGTRTARAISLGASPELRRMIGI
jgi:PAS domain S-box-containing protein